MGRPDHDHRRRHPEYDRRRDHCRPHAPGLERHGRAHPGRGRDQCRRHLFGGANGRPERRR